LHDRASHIVVAVQAAQARIVLLIYRPADWEIFLARLEQAMPVTRLEGSLEELGPLVDAIVCWRVPDDVLDKLPNLKWIQTTSSGVDHLGAYLRRRRGGDAIAVSTTKGMNAELVAEFVLLSILAHRWRLVRLLEQQRRRIWSVHSTAAAAGSTCAVIGVGEIGGRVARLAKSLGMSVLGIRRSARAEPGVDEMFGPQHLHVVLERADFVVLSLPLTASTERLIGAAEFAIMKPTAVLVNVSRGPVVHEAALVQALRDGRIAGASLDVTDVEPCPTESPLWETPNLILTPHLAGERADYAAAAAGVWVGNVLRFVRGESPTPASTEHLSLPCAGPGAPHPG